MRWEAELNWNRLIRQTHRWLSIAFTLAVILNLVFLMQKEQVVWVGLLDKRADARKRRAAPIAELLDSAVDQFRGRGSLLRFGRGTFCCFHDRPFARYGSANK